MTTAGEDALRDLFGKAEPEADLRLSREPRNDDGNAVRLRRRFGRDLIHVKDLGWHIWSGKHWDQEHGELQAQKLALRTARLIMDEAAAMEMAGPLKDRATSEVVETPAEFEKRVDSLRKWSTASGNMPRIKGMLDALAVELERDRAQLDANPFAFTVENGTIHLRSDGTWALRPHDRQDLITRVATVTFDPGADCPEFIKWLEFILPDEADPEADGDHRVPGAIRSLLQRFFGYCLTGSTGQQVAPLFCGTGANGKSTLVNVMRGIFGPYAQTLPVETLLENDRKGGGDATPDIARLPGARLALASEPEKKSRLSTAKLKQLTGGEPITARALYGGFFEFNPAFKMVLSFNDRPSVPAQDDGTWRRVLLIMFNQKIPKEQRKERFELELLKEAPGILNWLLGGYAEWRQGGLKVPESVRSSTEQYRNDNDPIGEFIKDCCLDILDMRPGPNGEPPIERAVNLYSAYEVWCEETASDPITRRIFGLRLRDKGYAKRKSNGTVYESLQLSEEWLAKAGDQISRRQARSAFGRPKREE